MSGLNNMMCIDDIAKAGLKSGYRVGVVLHRCTNNIPITSYQLSCSYSWEDISSMFDFVYQTYVIDSNTKQKKCKFYAFGVSLGAV
jgi:predicted alpha/beta-fold hydrolase